MYYMPLKAFIHEMGHLFGARHDRFTDNRLGLNDTYQHGFFTNFTRADKSDITTFRDNTFMMYLLLLKSKKCHGGQMFIFCLQ